MNPPRPLQPGKGYHAAGNARGRIPETDGEEAPGVTMPNILSIPLITWRAWKVWHRNLTVFTRTWKVNFFPPLVEALLYLFAIGMGIGSYVREIEGIPYVTFIAPAILTIAVMNSAFFECTYGSYVRMYYQKSFDAMIATPLSIEDVIAGELLWGATRSLIYVLIMLPVLALFGVISLPLALLAIPLAFIGGLMFAGIAMCFTSVTPSIDTLNYPAFLFITPMALFSGTFFPLTLMPAALQYMALTLLPLTHLVAMMRMFTLATISPVILLHLVWIVVVTIICCIAAINLMRRRLIV
jgi:lipooligosaccharide transport system permease protein